MSITFDEYLEKNSYATFTHYELKKHDARVRADAIEEFVEQITLPITTEEQINQILEQLKEKQNESS